MTVETPAIPCDHEGATLVCGDSQRAIYWCEKCGNNVVLTRPQEPGK